MIYATIDVNVITHEKALAAGIEAFGLWAWGMCYAQVHQTDGRLPRVAVLSALRGRRNVMLASRLVTAGLWNLHEDGSWSIHNYSKKNQTAQEIAERKAANLARQQTYRQNKRRLSRVTDDECNALQAEGVTRHITNNNNNTNTSVGETAPEAPPQPKPEPKAEPEMAPSMARYAEAYCAGIRTGKGGGYAWPGTKYAEWDMGKLVQEFARDPEGRPYRGEQLLRFIQHTAREFAEDITKRGDEVKFYAAFAPKGCLKWLAEVERAEEARRVG